MRPPAPLPPGPGQRSVWDFPRPPALERDDRLVVVELGGEVVCRTTGALLVLETSHPPGWYLPEQDFAAGALEPASGTSLCEWKGTATYLTVVGGGRRAERAAWTYRDPVPAYAALRGHVALYPAAVDRVTVAGEQVRAQEGGFYGGWVTGDVVGPFKGGPGSTWW
jgi:uncharacterized protein (DUF427 family)